MWIVPVKRVSGDGAVRLRRRVTWAIAVLAAESVEIGRRGTGASGLMSCGIAKHTCRDA